MITMALSNLTEEETEIVFQCLRCVATGEVIPNDFEFHTLFGIEFNTFRTIVDRLPNLDESDEATCLAINNSMANLLGYPHGQQSIWGSSISAPATEVARIFVKWRAGGRRANQIAEPPSLT